MELCRTYGAIECSGIIDDRVTPYPKLYHPFRVFIELTLNKRFFQRFNFDFCFVSLVPRSDILIKSEIKIWVKI